MTYSLNIVWIMYIKSFHIIDVLAFRVSAQLNLMGLTCLLSQVLMQHQASTVLNLSCAFGPYASLMIFWIDLVFVSSSLQALLHSLFPTFL